MSDTDPVSRRGLLRAAAGATAAAGAASATAGTATAQSEQPAFSELEGIDGGIEDLRGESAVTVAVGASGNGGSIAFSPAGIWIDPGTTVTWEWTGDGGAHNVATTDGPASLESEQTDEAGFTYEFEFTEEHAGITNYECVPHASLGMLGAVAVGDDVETVTVGGGGGGGGAPQIPDSAKTLGLATFVAMVSTLGFAFFFLKYGGDYDDAAE
jgi:halocyanin-like protein